MGGGCWLAEWGIMSHSDITDHFRGDRSNTEKLQQLQMFKKSSEPDENVTWSNLSREHEASMNGTRWQKATPVTDNRWTDTVRNGRSNTVLLSAALDCSSGLSTRRSHTLTLPAPSPDKLLLKSVYMHTYRKSVSSKVSVSWQNRRHGKCYHKFHVNSRQSATPNTAISTTDS